MKRLILKKLVIISQKSEEARIIEFDSKLNIITGDNPDGITINRTGKSVVMKSIYHSMGAKLKKYTSNWPTLQICTIITFEYNDKEYEIYRNRDYFIFRSNQDVKFFKSISELREFYVTFFDFYIRMPIKADDENAVFAYPGAIFMPFYIDQDKGWSGSWDSFSDIFTGKWKTEILLYHMGIRTKKYYELLDEKINLELEQKEIRRELNTITTIIKNHVEKYKDYMDINISIDKFSEEIINLTDELNLQLSKKNQIKEELINCFNEMKELEELYSVADKVYNELLLDVDYVESKATDDEIICPTCGTVHNNSIENRFHLYSEIEECEKTIQDYFEERGKIEKRVQKQSEELKKLDNYIAKINDILNRKRETVTFKEIVVSEGSKSILDDMKSDQRKLQNRIGYIGDRIRDITNEQTTISKRGTHITKLYLEKLNTSFSLLNVTDLDLKELEKFKASFNSGGNDLPCAILAQVYTLYAISTRNSSTVSAPIVLDAIFQQEPAEEKINTIWEYVIGQQPVNSQVILSTTTTNGRTFDGKVFQLTEEKGLFKREDYLQEKEKISWYKNIMLDTLKNLDGNR